MISRTQEGVKGEGTQESGEFITEEETKMAKNSTEEKKLKTAKESNTKKS